MSSNTTFPLTMDGLLAYLATRMAYAYERGFTAEGEIGDLVNIDTWYMWMSVECVCYICNLATMLKTLTPVL